MTRLFLLNIYLEMLKTFIHEDICTAVFITASYTVAKMWKQSKSPLMDEWIKKMWRIHTMEYYSAVRKDETAIYNDMHGS